MANKIAQPETRTILRSTINFASYNPRKITEEARKKLKANLKRVGLLGGIVWNEDTGNLVSGHQRIAVMDDVNKYNPNTHENDYDIKVEVAHFDIKTEKEQNLFMNNRSTQGEFDDDMLKKMLDGIDFNLAGFDDFDLQMLGIGDVDISSVADSGTWEIDKVLEDDRLQIANEIQKNGIEDKSIDRSANFYDDTAENQLARHNEVQKIKDRIARTNDENKDGGMLSYVVLSFKTPQERMNFMQTYGYNDTDRYIDGTEFMNRIEFGIEEDK